MLQNHDYHTPQKSIRVSKEEWGWPDSFTITREHRNLVNRSEGSRSKTLSLPGHTTISGIRLNIPSLSTNISCRQWPEKQKISNQVQRGSIWSTVINELVLPWALNTLSSASCEYEILVALRSWRNSSFTIDGGTSLTFKDAYNARKYFH